MPAPADADAQPAPRSRTSIRRSLVVGSVTLVASALLLCAAAIDRVIYRPLVDDLAASEMRRASDEVTADIDTFFARIEGIAARHRSWGRRGVFDLGRPDQLNDLLTPYFTPASGVTGMAIAAATGQEVLIGALDGGWVNRLTDPDRLGRRGRFLTWSRDATLIGDQTRDVDYDARQRPWFKAVMQLPTDGEMFWTQPYRFASTGEAGLSAVVRWRAPDHQLYAMTTDVRLLDLSRRTQQIDVGRTGMAVVVTEDGRVLGLPRDPGLDTRDAAAAAALQPVEALGIAPLSDAFREWRARGRPATGNLAFVVRGTDWLAAFRQIHPAGQSFWIATLAPSGDFGVLTRNIAAIGAALIAITLALAMLGAAWLGRRLSQPIERLAVASARIGQLDLAHPIEATSPVREIDTLARALDAMRRGLIQAQAELAAKASLERQLEQARRLEAVGRLAAGIAHDFNNLLGSILGFAQFIVDDNAEGSDERRFAERILQAGRRAAALVAQILTFSRERAPESEIVDLIELVTETQALLRAGIPATTSLVTGQMAAALVDGDRNQIGQVLMNLCINASDALGDVPGTVEIAVGPPRLDEPLARLTGRASDVAAATEVWQAASGTICAAFGAIDPARRYVALSVADNGSGMSEATVRRIFDPFFTTKMAGRGTGLGLAVVHGIVLNHGGALLLETRVGAGTVIEVLLPAAAADQPSRAEPAAAAPSRPAGCGRILLVDDDADFGAMLAITLGRQGYSVRVFTDPGDALAAIRAGDPVDLLISDQTMPRMRGTDLVQAVRAMRPQLRCALCTGGAIGPDDLQAMAALATVIRKPVDFDRLPDLMREMLDDGATAGCAAANPAAAALISPAPP